MSLEFANGFCDFCGSCSDCLLGYCCPQISACLAANNADLGIFCAIVQCCFYPCALPFMRCQVRKARGIDGNIVKDLAAGWCCPCCAAIQIKREFD